MAIETATPSLSQQPSSTLIDLFFDTEDPEERDVLCDALALRADKTALSFFVAMLEQDEDPYLQVAAAAALLPHSAYEAAARAHLLGVLAQGADEVLFEEALAALLLTPSAELYDALQALGADEGRDLFERRLARVAMEQLDAARTVQAARALLRDEQAFMREPLDLAALALAALVRSGTQEDAATIDVAAHKLPQLMGPGLDADDLSALQDLFEEAQAVIRADTGEATDTIA